MKVRFGLEGTADAWLVTREEAPEAWVQELIDSGQAMFKQEKEAGLVYLKVLQGLGKSGVITQVITANAGGFGGFAQVPLKVLVGEYLVRRDGEFFSITPKKFAKEYKIL